MTYSRAIRIVALAALGCDLARAQTLVTLQQAVEESKSNYPAVRASMEKVNAAAAAVNLARTAYLPQAQMIGQWNRATTNNVYGMLLQQSVVSPISGPPVAQNRSTNVFGSAVGVLVLWEPFDFGARASSRALAEAGERRAEASVERQKFEAAASAADAFLTVLAAERQLRAAEAGVARAKTLFESVSALANAGMRPGADSMRSRAELSAFETQRIQAEQAVRLAKVALAEMTGERGELRLDPGGMAEPPPKSIEGTTAAHPAEREQLMLVEEVAAREKVIDRSKYPKFSVEGTTFARGTGALPDFSVLGGANGLAPTYYNWGIGFNVTYNLTEHAVLGAKGKIEAANERAERARLEQVKLELNSKLQKAQAILEGARKTASEVPIMLEAARAAERQAAARYQTGLATISEVAEAQRLLTDAEITMELAQLNVWRGLLYIAVAQGDLSGFLQAAR
jgi:outer membrane protein TolC